MTLLFGLRLLAESSLKKESPEECLLEEVREIGYTLDVLEIPRNRDLLHGNVV